MDNLKSVILGSVAAAVMLASLNATAETGRCSDQGCLGSDLKNWFDANARVDADRGTQEDRVKAIMLYGFIGGVFHMGKWLPENLKSCPPKSLNNFAGVPQIMSVINTFIRTKPQALTMSAERVVVSSMLQVFPCK